MDNSGIYRKGFDSAENAGIENLSLLDRSSIHVQDNHLTNAESTVLPSMSINDTDLVAKNRPERSERKTVASDRNLEMPEADKASEHINLNFKVDPTYLAFYTLANEQKWVNEPNQDVIAFQNKARALDPESYRYIVENWMGDEIADNSPRTGPPERMRAWQLIDRMTNDSSFVPILQESNRALERVKNEWEKNLPITQTIVENLTGLALNKDLNVFISHPSIKTGFAGNGNVFWTDRSDFPNYNTIYLWHEILHNIIEPRIVGANNYDVGHAVIELLADNELRIQLNGGSILPLEGHAEHIEGMKYLLPSWEKYVSKTGKKNINNYIDEAAVRIEKMPAD